MTLQINTIGIVHLKLPKFNQEEIHNMNDAI